MARLDNLRIDAMTETAALVIRAWRYPAPYDFYDLDADLEDLAEFLDPTSWGVSLFAAYRGGQLIGWYGFVLDQNEIEIGLGMHPGLVGRRLGPGFITAGLDFAALQWPDRAVQLRVAAFNERARKAYEKVGFRVVRSFNQHTNGADFDFLLMKRDACLPESGE